MHTKRFVSCGKVAVSAALSMGLIFAQTPVAFAEEAASENTTEATENTEAPQATEESDKANTSTQGIEKITEEMTKLYIEAEQSQYDLISVNKHLSQTEDLISEIDVRIDQSSQDLQKAKDELSDFVANDYKQGSISLLDIIFKATSFDDLVSRITYANKVAEHQRNVIKQIDEIYALLTRQKSDLEAAHEVQQRYIVEQGERSVEADNATAAAVAFLQALPEETIQQIATADVEQREAAMQASLQLLSTMDQSQLESLFGGSVAGGGDAGSESGSESAPAASGAAAIVEALISSGGSDYSGGEASVSGGSTSSSYTGTSDLLSRVYSLLGAGYQWSGYNYTGDTSTSSFTCSGVVDYALGRDSRSSSPETLYEEVGSNITTDVSSLQEGDLVFYSYGGRSVGHVGVYVGNGQVIDSIPNGGVAIRDVNYMEVVGGGSLGGSSSYSYSDYEQSYSDYDSYYDYTDSYY